MGSNRGVRTTGSNPGGRAPSWLIPRTPKWWGRQSWLNSSRGTDRHLWDGIQTAENCPRTREFTKARTRSERSSTAGIWQLTGPPTHTRLTNSSIVRSTTARTLRHLQSAHDAIRTQRSHPSQPYRSGPRSVPSTAGERSR